MPTKLDHNVADLKRQLDEALAERGEAEAQRAAVAEILEIINSSPGDVAPVFDTILKKAHDLCGAELGVLLRYDGECYWPLAAHGTSARFLEHIRQGFRPGVNNPFARVLREEEPFVQIPDIAEFLAQGTDDPELRIAADMGIRTFVVVPLLKDGKCIGAISANRRTVRPLTDKQLALLQSFAAQVVLAMENARLLGELRQRTDDLQTSLEYQTATSDVLKAISRSDAELGSVLENLVVTATRLCQADYGHIFRQYEGRHHLVAHCGIDPEYRDFLIAHPFVPDRGTLSGRVALAGQIVQIEDAATDPEYTLTEAQQRGNLRTGLGVPLIREDTLLGIIILYRSRVESFTDKQISLAATFADQAVIAIENARLLGELRQRTDDLQESLKYQTATSDVLQTISRSAFDLQAVLDTLSETAARLCAAELGFMTRRDGDAYRFVTAVGSTPETTADAIRLKETVLDRQSFVAGRGSITGRVISEAKTVQIDDLASDPEYALNELITVGKIQTLLGVPLMREGAVIGTMSLGRQRVEPFTERQIELVQTFADQAVIALENARLITETREALEQQTATAEVLGVINSSPGDLVPVFDAMLEKALRLCEAAFGFLWTWNGEQMHRQAFRGVPDELLEEFREPLKPPPGSIPERIINGERVVSDLDVLEGPRRSPILARLGARSCVGVALRKDNKLLGGITIYRGEIRPFAEKQLALLQNFAAQAVIAMENARLITETREALDQQTATAEVLGVINSSPGDLAPVFEAILEKAHSLCGAEYGSLNIYDGDQLRAVAVRGLPEGFADRLRLGFRPDAAHPTRILENGVAFVQIPNLAETTDPVMRIAFETTGMRTALFLPLRKDDRLLGHIVAARPEVRLYSDKQIALLQNFAAQAVIAMENARLITETREALEQQTATAEVLQVINASPGDLAPVFNAMLDKATSLCESDIGILFTYDDGSFIATAWHGTPEPFREFLAEPLRPSPDTGLGRMVVERRLIHVADVSKRDSYLRGDALSVASVELGGIRTFAAVPLVKDDALVGAFVVYRREVRPFSDKQIALLQNFAVQAVIAMENARLITETREALEQQTATAEVLQVINSSPGDLAPVFDAMLEKAMHLCDSAFGILWMFDQDRLAPTATRGVPAGFTNHQFGTPPGPGTAAYRFLSGERSVIQNMDLANENVYRAGDPLRRSLVDLAGARSALHAPLCKDSVVLGVITIYRQEVRPFTDKQIALLQNFAAQAVIAIENARLLDEIRQRQTELRVTFDNMGDGVVMFDTTLRMAASNRNFEEILDLSDEFVASRHGFDDFIRYLAERGEFGETKAESEIARLHARLRDHYSFERTRPDGTVIEVRHNPMPDGGVVLIYSDITERKRSEAEIKATRDAAEAAYRDLKAAQANLVQAEKMASLGQLTAGIAHEIKNPLNFVNNFAGLSVELLDELKEVTAPAMATLDEDKRAEADETIDLLTSNLEKIAEHGRRADGIVKSMLEHSRGGTGERRSVDLNALVEEALNLAYHGGRAQDQSFNITLERDYARDLAPIKLVPQDITRVCLNLFGNGFYAATKRQKEGGDPTFKPILKVMTRDLGDAVEIRARDNGGGIPPEVRDKLFQPFFTTKPTGEGTGLGLSISYDIVTQQHGGTIEVDSQVGEFTEFTVRLPRRTSPRAAA